MLSRRILLLGSACGLALPAFAASRSGKPATNLATAPIELAGDWGHMLPGSILQVLERMRRACLDGVRLVSDDQPARLRVAEAALGYPSIWLHPDDGKLAWIIVVVGERDWSKLAYQFGHELGHVVANSWRANAKPAPPCQWLEEALVEAFSLHGLGNLADGWSRDPPFAGDSAFGAAIAVYRQNVIERYGKLAREQGHADDPAAWFATHRLQIEAGGGLNPFAQAFATTILAQYERDPACIEALGALNRWPGRSRLAAGLYIDAWKRSCAELGASPTLPIWIGRTLGVG